MDPITSGIAIGLAANAIYKALEVTGSITVDILKQYFDNPPSDDVLDQIASKAIELEVDDEWSPRKIERAMAEDPAFLQMLNASNVSNSTVINQHHSGTGDNVAGNKIVTE